MPKKKETIYDSNGRAIGERETGQDEDLVTKAKVGTTAGANLGARQAPAGDDRPKAADYQNDLPGLQRAWAAYRAKSKKP